MKMSLILDILVWVICLLVVAWAFGGLQVSFNPFTIKLTTWVRLLGVIFVILGIVCLEWHYSNLYYKEGFNDACNQLKEVITEKSEDYIKERTETFKVILYRGNTKEIRETLESVYGILPLSSPVEGGYLLVAGNRYSVVEEIDESIPELFDCSDSLSVFYEACRALKNSY